KNMIYKYGAANPAYKDRYGTHALLWEAIQWGCKNGYEIMDWGKTEKSNQGLRNFKLGWGTDEKDLIYSYIGSSPKDYSSGWKQKVVEKVIQNSPVWVGRIFGELLYKHVG
ncbi:MAG: GNAT family N-acetyltransferase, partial [Deltaproteobacteria bacterium]|nr:GNAT family N-acetyltransferase [Deltaproteobacteria bacterium]